MSTSQPQRLDARPGEAIDRAQVLRFSFNGQPYEAHPGDTIGSALAAAGVRTISRSFKYHRPRGLLCAAGHCPNCLVRVGTEPNVRACQRPVADGLVVRSQNAWPSVEHDLLAITQLGSRFMPVGFYYKTFLRPAALWPFYEELLRRAAGLGVVDPLTPPGEFDKQFLHAEVAVVGGGPAGLSAALAAARAGARVLVFDENPALGGSLRFAGDRAALAALLRDLAQQPLIETYPATTVVACYTGHWLAAVRGNRLFKIRAQAVVVATGAYETPLVFDDNDLPGVMLGSAVQRLVNLHGVAPGRRAVVVTANDDGWQVAADLHAAGVAVLAVADERATSASPHVAPLETAGVRALFRHTIRAARGRQAVTGAVLVRDGDDAPQDHRVRTLACDLIAVSVGWTPAAGLLHLAGATGAFDPQRGEFLAGPLPPGLLAAGRVQGTHELALQLTEGRLAGQAAAAAAGRGAAPAAGEWDTLRAAQTAAPRRTSTRISVPGDRKRFICYCEDVTDRDLETAIAEGFDSVELLKRYSTISMGPCQGKMCGTNARHLCARARGLAPETIGRTTSRPPLSPVTLGALAGQHLEPVQYTSVHDWHRQRGAKLMAAGLWMRPEHYGDPAGEVAAVRQRVGLIDVSTLGKLQLTGPGVARLLERLYVNQWQSLATGRVRYALLCNDEGVVIDDGVGARLGDQHWYLTTTTAGAAAVFELIQWWLQAGWGAGVHAINLTEAFAAFNLAGPQARAVLQKLTDADLSREAFPYMQVRCARVAGVDCRLLRIGFTGELSYEIHAPAELGLHLWEALLTAGDEFGIAPFGVEAQRVLRLEKAHLIIGQDTDALADAFAAGMAGVVKMDKPDFLGRRALVRAAATGPRQQLVGFTADGELAPEEGLQIVTTRGGRQEISGWVTSSRYSPTLKGVIGLCWLPAAVAAQHGAPFTIHRGSARLSARVHHGAFYDPEGKRLRT